MELRRGLRVVMNPVRRILNHTYVELRHRVAFTGDFTLIVLNRTYVELRPIILTFISLFLTFLNRTYVELRLITPFNYTSS